MRRALNQQAVDGHGHRGFFQVGGVQQGLLARPGDILQEGRKQRRAHRQALDGLLHAGLQLIPGGQAGLTGALCGLAWKVTAGAFEIRELALIDLRLKYGGDFFRRAQHGLAAIAGYDNQIAYVRRAHVGAQLGIEFDIGG